MKILQNILYGLILGHWILQVKWRIFPGKTQWRYAIVGMHSGKEEYILVGRCTDKNQALAVTDYIEDNTMFYIGICYDLLDPYDRIEFEKRLYCPHIEKEDDFYVHEAMRICAGN